MLYTRYRYAAEHAKGRDVLEVARGSGQGVGYLARSARRVVGGDYTDGLLRTAAKTCLARVPLVCLDAEALPFRQGSFDLVVPYEAIYYLPGPGRFLIECRRVLRSGGVLLICSVNSEWSDFNPSPHSVRYYSARELTELLQGHGFRVELKAAFPAARSSPRGVVNSFLKRVAVALGLIPKTMKGKAVLKRLFLGRLARVPAEIDDGLAIYCPPVLVTGHGGAGGSDFKVLFVIGHAK